MAAILGATSPLLFNFVDSLQLPLHPIGGGYKSDNTAELDIGPWSVNATLKVKSDVLTKDIASFWVHVKEDLWLYFVSQDQGNSATIIVFSGEAANVSKGLLVTPCENGTVATLNSTIARLRKVGVTYSLQKDKWVVVNTKKEG